jgi:hypothetical protein
MIILLFILFITAIVFCFVPVKENSSAFLILSVIGLSCILIISLRGGNVDNDYQSYKELFSQKGFDIRVEPTFLLIKYVVSTLLGNRFIYLIIIYAFLAVTIKFYGIIKISEFWFFSILIYLSNVFIIQDMTQIRAAVCSSILLLSIIPLKNKNNLGFFLLATLACLFHFSGLIIFLFWFLDTEKLNRKFWVLVIPFCYIAFLFHLNASMVSKLIPIPTVQAKLNVYFLLQESSKAIKVNVFSILILIRVVLVYLFMYKLDFLYSKNPYAIVALKIYLLSIGVIIIAADVSALAFRLNELLSISEIITIPFLIYLFKPKIVGQLLVVLFAVMLVFFHVRAHTLIIF